MPIFEWRSLCRNCVLEDASADYRVARRAGQYMVGREAVYATACPGAQYLPFAALTYARLKHTAAGAPGHGEEALPVVHLRVFYDGECCRDLFFEERSEAELVLDALRAARPDLPMDLDAVPCA